MKNMNSIVLLFCVFLLCTSCTRKDEFNGSVSGDIQSVYAKLVPAEEIATSANGKAVGKYYANINVLDLYISWRKVIKSDSQADPILGFVFYNSTGEQIGKIKNEQNVANGSYSIKFSSKNGLTDVVKEQLLMGKLKLAVSTQAYPDGIIDGQLAIGVEEPEEDIQSKYDIKHPCLFYTQNDFDFVAGKIQNQEQPWTRALELLKEHDLCKLSYNVQTTEYIVRDGRTNPPVAVNYSVFDKATRVAWMMALRWKFTGEEAYGKKAIEIMDAWARDSKGPYTENGSYINPDMNLIALEIPDILQAAEIMRESDLWSKEKAEIFGNWLVNNFANHCIAFFSRPTNKGSMSNWDMAQVQALLAMGIYTNNDDLIDIAINYFKEGAGNGSIIHALPRDLYHKDPDSNETLAQYAEAGRDQGHGSLSVRVMADICQLAKNIGVDLYGYQENGILAMTEYCCKLNLTKKYPFDRPSSAEEHSDNDFKYPIASIPYRPYKIWEGTQFEINFETISLKDRGSFCPVNVQVYYHYTPKGFSAKYAKEYMDFYPIDVDDYYLRNNLMYRR